MATKKKKDAGPFGLPVSVVILGRKLRVDYAPLVTKKEELMGYYEASVGVIGIDSNQPKPMMVDTLVHECIHAYYQFLGGLDHVAESELEETFVLHATTIMFQLLAENPAIREALCDELG